MGTFSDLEYSNTQQNTEISQEALFYELANLKSLTSTMATSNDTSTYIQNNNSTYITTNLADKNLNNSQINLILFINSSNQVIYSKGYDPVGNKDTLVSKNMADYITQENPLNNSNTTIGIFLLPEGPMLISTSPIMRDGEGPVEGTLVIGRNMNMTEIEQLNSYQNLSLSIIPFDASESIPTYHNLNSYFTYQDPSIVVEPQTSNSITGYSILRDNQGKAVFELKLQMPRSIYNQANNTLLYFIISFLIVGLVLLTTTLLYLDRIVLFRLNSITTAASSIAKNFNISKRIYITGRDELSKLADSINNMLISLEHSKDEIQKSKEKYKNIFMNTGTAIVIIEEDDMLPLVNAEFEKLSGYSKVEIENKKYWTDFFVGDDLEKVREYRRLRSSNHLVPRNYEIQFIDKKGEVKLLYLTVSIIPGSKKSLISCLNITQLKKSEEDIKKSLKEKEVLIREIHHRVKNNMQIIISLLSLQSMYLDDDRINDVFMECQNRVTSMGMIHESLYQSKDLSSINFLEYIKKLIQGLFTSYGINTNKIKYKINVEDISLSIDTAIPLGLLLNEIISNSLKHAFPNNREGVVYIDFHRENDHKFKLIVGDNGVGFDKEIDLKHIPTLGLNLINTLVNQLEGTIKLYKDGKTKFIIKFSELKYKKRI
jgi:PAS domain S-box-containing protein